MYKLDNLDVCKYSDYPHRLRELRRNIWLGTSNRVRSENGLNFFTGFISILILDVMFIETSERHAEPPNITKHTVIHR